MTDIAIYAILAVIGFLAVLAIWAIMSFNRLRALETRCDQAMQDIDVQLKRRSDLLPNLASTVRSFVDQESELMTVLRDIQMDANSVAKVRNKSRSMGNLNASISTVFASLDKIPDLQSSPHYRQLRSEILHQEDRIEAARRFLNLATAEFNKSRSQFPGSLVAGFTRIGKRDGYSLGDDRVFHDQAPTLNV